MEIVSAKNPVWANKDKTAITLLVTFDTIGEVSFTASSTDCVQHGVDIYNNAVAGQYGTIGDYAEPTMSADVKYLVYRSAIQKVLNDAAVASGYFDISDVCSYAGVTCNKQAEALTFFNWRLEVWDYCDEFLAAIKANSTSVPTIEEIIAGLPVRVVS